MFLGDIICTTLGSRYRVGLLVDLQRQPHKADCAALELADESS